MALMLLVVAVPAYAGETAAKNKPATIERTIKRKYKKVQFVDTVAISDKQFWKIILHRTNKKYYVVAKVLGFVLNSKKDGRDTEGYYISYRGIKGVREGSVVLTYLVYGKGNNEPDDIIARYDVVLKR